jgi:hypothetical protein
MLAILHLLAMFVADLFKPRRQLEDENLFLRHQLNIALRRAPCRLRLRGSVSNPSSRFPPRPVCAENLVRLIW